MAQEGVGGSFRNFGRCEKCGRGAPRSLEQNARLWALLRFASEHVEWYGRHLTPEEWKDVFSAAMKHQTAVPGINGGFVILGAHTSRMTKKEHADLQTLIEAFLVDKVPLAELEGTGILAP